MADGQVRTALVVMKMDCPTEEALIRGKLGGMTGIGGLEFNLVQRTLTVTHAPGALEPAVAAIRSLGMDAVIRAEHAQPAEARGGGEARRWWLLAGAGLAAVASEVAHWLEASPWLVAALALAAIVVGGLRTFAKGWVAVRNRNLNMNALMSIAVTGAMIIGEWPEAAMVMVLFALAEVIEAKSLDRARHAISGLLELAPDKATVRQADGSWREAPAAGVAIGAIVRVGPGERIALDGEVVAGRSAVNQAPITGESLPVEKAPGDQVFAGTVNESGSFEYRVTAPATSSTLARVIHAVEEAQGARAPTQRFVDRFARIYTPAVFAVALVAAVAPPLFLGAAWIDALYRALVLLVIGCPCALVISTPVAIVSGLAAAARKGILVKGGVWLEQGRRLRIIALDKTGTLTHGRPAQTDQVALVDDDPALLRQLAASLAARSDHPVSGAIARAAADDGVALLDVVDFAALPGRGVAGRVAGRSLRLGNHLLIEELGRCSDQLEDRLDVLEREGKTVVVLADEARALALFAVADTLKDSSRQAVAELRALGVRAVMLSGDNEHTAAAIAAEVGIADARGGLLPEAKLDAIAALEQAGMVGMVGDGINDAPALAKASIGFAMGAAGTDAAIETADVALMDDDLRKIPAFIGLSRATVAVLVQNIALALGIKAVFLVLAVLGHATLWMAVFADMGASLIVVFNSLRLLRA